MMIGENFWSVEFENRSRGLSQMIMVTRLHTYSTPHNKMCIYDTPKDVKRYTKRR